jgi:hypothetical protein
MKKQQFQSEMLRAQTMQRLEHEPNKVDYWLGYMRGLRRSFHGLAFGSAAEHEMWLSLVGDDDESRNQRGLGYHDGLAFGN